MHTSSRQFFFHVLEHTNGTTRDMATEAKYFAVAVHCGGGLFSWGGGMSSGGGVDFSWAVGVGGTSLPGGLASVGGIERKIALRLNHGLLQYYLTAFQKVSSLSAAPFHLCRIFFLCRHQYKGS